MKKEDFLKNSRKIALIIFLIAIMVRLSLLVLLDQNHISKDSIGYHRIAINLVKGNGFSNQEKAPFEKYYFREPGYTSFLAGIYAVVNVFHPIAYMQEKDIKKGILTKNHPEIIVAKIIQIVLNSVGIVLLFFSLLQITNNKMACLTCLLTAVFLNFAAFSLDILRESLIVFLLLCLNLVFIQHVQSKQNYLRLSMMGVIIGLLILVFQVHIVLLPVFLIMILLKTRKFLKSLIETSFITLISLLIVLPYCIHVYNFYPNIKIFKTFGTSFTYEMAAYVGAVNRLLYYGKISQSEASAMMDWNKGSREQFDKSFNGYYLRKAALLNSLVFESSNSQRRLKIYFINFRKSIFLEVFYHQSRTELIKNYGVVFTIPLIVIPILIGIFGLLGLLVYWKKYLLYFFPFMVYIMMFRLLGNEHRRMIIVQPFLIFFSLLLINGFLCKYNNFKKKLDA